MLASRVSGDDHCLRRSFRYTSARLQTMDRMCPGTITNPDRHVYSKEEMVEAWTNALHNLVSVEMDDEWETMDAYAE